MFCVLILYYYSMYFKVCNLKKLNLHADRSKATFIIGDYFEITGTNRTSSRPTIKTSRRMMIKISLSILPIVGTPHNILLTVRT